MSESKHKMSENKLVASTKIARSLLPIDIARFWNKIQGIFASKKLNLIDFSSDEPDDNYWRWQLASSVHTINLRIKRTYKHPHTKIGKWANNLEREISKRGFFVPQKDIINLGEESLHNHLSLLQKIYSDFPIVFYIQSIQKKSKSIPVPFLALQYHFEFYTELLREIFTTDFKAVSDIRKVLDTPIVLIDFEKKLPSEQLVTILYALVHQYFCDNYDESHWKQILKKSAPAIQSFWEKHSSVITQYVKHSFSKKSTKKPVSIFSSIEIEQDFFKICQSDFELITIQEILDNASGNNFIHALSGNIKENFGLHRKTSFKQKIKKILQAVSILQRIQNITQQNDTKPKPHFFLPQKKWILPIEQNWYDLSQEDCKLILNEIALLEYPYDKLLRQTANDRWDIHLQQLCNNKTAPFLLWEKEGQYWFPQINVFPIKQAEALKANFQKNMEKEQEELEKLKQLLAKLYLIKTLTGLQKFRNGITEFRFSAVQEKWNNAYRSYFSAVKNREKYRIIRMKEFGILKTGETVTSRKQIWLDEMLDIEKEVRPFISFVKQAFHAALPVRKTVEFHPFRHSMDGVEFDPETIQNQEKWLNGEVMKTLRNKIEKGRIEQINAFVLDSSGSMNHEKMRNLFKLCYLLVLGLEERKTYDAFHFFSTSFIETANLSHEYTNRALLFKVLLNISEIQHGKIRFKGRGGTNISQGVFECHARIQKFSEELKARYPNIQHLKSIFLLTDGEPTAGIVDVEKLNIAINEKRKDGNFAIKGIYFKPEGEQGFFMEEIFGKDEYVESEDFADLLQQFIHIMTLTYKKQRQDWKQRQKQKRTMGSFK